MLRTKAWPLRSKILLQSQAYSKVLAKLIQEILKAQAPKSLRLRNRLLLMMRLLPLWKLKTKNLQTKTMKSKSVSPLLKNSKLNSISKGLFMNSVQSFSMQSKLNYPSFSVSRTSSSHSTLASSMITLTTLALFKRRKHLRLLAMTNRGMEASAQQFSGEETAWK